VWGLEETGKHCILIWIFCTLKKRGNFFWKSIQLFGW